MPAEAEAWSLATRHERLVKTGARIVFAEISRRIDLLRPAALGMKHRERGQKALPRSLMNCAK